MPERVIALITAGSREEAERIADTLVVERLAACVNVIPGVLSVYHWAGKVQHDQEWLLIVKSRSEVVEDLVRRVQALHSYDVPEIVVLPLTGGSEPYLHWLDEQVQSVDATGRQA
jgi:periplasmic divalent cation tolerance protein